MLKDDKPDVLEAIVKDEYAGQGGSYLYDPVTGKRTPLSEEQTKQAVEEVLSKEWLTNLTS